MPHTHSLLSRLPGLDALLRLPATRHLITRHGRHAVSEAARAELEQLRAHVRQHAGWPQWFAGIDSLPPRLEAHCRRRQQPALRPVFNLTGTILHTNLGRAIQADAAIDAADAGPWAGFWPVGVGLLLCAPLVLPMLGMPFGWH